jgi:hypothetical protein
LLASPGFATPVELLNYKNSLDAPLVERFGSYPILIVSATLFAAVNFFPSSWELFLDLNWTMESSGATAGLENNVEFSS